MVIDNHNSTCRFPITRLQPSLLIPLAASLPNLILLRLACGLAPFNPSSKCTASQWCAVPISHLHSGPPPHHGKVMGTAKADYSSAHLKFRNLITNRSLTDKSALILGGASDRHRHLQTSPGPHLLVQLPPSPARPHVGWRWR